MLGESRFLLVVRILALPECKTGARNYEWCKNDESKNVTIVHPLSAFAMDKVFTIVLLVVVVQASSSNLFTLGGFTIFDFHPDEMGTAPSC